MTTEHSGSGLIGKSVHRVEDAALLIGKGCFVDDIQLPGTLHMALLRSPYPHAKVNSINTTAARAIPGVETVITGEDISESLFIPVPQMVRGMKIPPHPVLARGVVHAAGVPVAAVVAQTRAKLVISSASSENSSGSVSTKSCIPSQSESGKLTMILFCPTSPSLSRTKTVIVVSPTFRIVC